MVKKLKDIFGGLYNNDNVLVSGTHTHSVPSGYFQYVLYEVGRSVHSEAVYRPMAKYSVYTHVVAFHGGSPPVPHAGVITGVCEADTGRHCQWCSEEHPESTR